MGRRRRSFPYTEDDLATEERLWALYERWQRYHGVTRSPDEMRARIHTFADTAKFVLEANRSSTYSYKLALNQFGDMKPQEVCGCMAPREPRRKNQDQSEESINQIETDQGCNGGLMDDGGITNDDKDNSPKREE